MSPRTLFRVVAVTEAITWTGLLAGMFLKYVPETTEFGVQVFGPLHGIAFIAYCLVTLVVAVDQRWSRGRTLLGLASAIPPLMTVWFDRRVERQHGLHSTWHSRDDSKSRARRSIAWLRAHGSLAALGFVAAVAALTGVALLAGPPVG